MNTAPSPHAPQALPLTPVLPELADAMAAEDEEWQGFLSLGLPVDAAEPFDGLPWRNTPVLLSY